MVGVVGRAGTLRTARGATATALLAVAAVACLVAVLAAASLGPVSVSADSPADRLVLAGRDADVLPGQEEVAAVRDDPPQPEPEGGIPPEVVISLAAAIVAGGLLVRSLLLARPDPAPEDDDEDGTDDDTADPGADGLEDVAAAARRALARLDAADPARSSEAVLASWVLLEEAGGRLGRGRAHTDTPSDFAGRLLSAVPDLDATALADLRRTYSRVRFGRVGAGPDDVRRCRQSLQELLAVLEPGTAVGVVGSDDATVRP